MKVGIAGAGGIGSNVAVHLVRSGVEVIKIVDFDKIEDSNLNRQFYFKDQIGKNKVHALYENLKRINPNLQLEVINRKLDSENIHATFYDCPVLVEAFDKKEYKSILIEENLPYKKLIVSASGIANSDLDKVETREFSKNLYVVGDFETDIQDFKTYSTKVSYVASIMAELILEKGGYYDK